MREVCREFNRMALYPPLWRGLLVTLGGPPMPGPFASGLCHVRIDECSRLADYDVLMLTETCPRLRSLTLSTRRTVEKPASRARVQSS